jgi:hypothetical protein
MGAAVAVAASKTIANNPVKGFIDPPFCGNQMFGVLLDEELCVFMLSYLFVYGV